ncbi:MAG: site-specific integrase [Sulfuricaulis sp.]|nr:site-specific integrase [Sulfuricaulis sp.]
MKFDETGWKSLGTLEYNRRLNAFLNRMNSGIDRGDEHAAVEHVRKLFADLAANPLDHAALARDHAAARKLEDGE